MTLLCRIVCLFAVFCFLLSSCAAENPISTANNWKAIPTAFRPVNVAAQGRTIWVCGADEMILTSRDGGATWETKHQNHDGEVLLNISFVDEKTGCAAVQAVYCFRRWTRDRPGRVTKFLSPCATSRSPIRQMG